MIPIDLKGKLALVAGVGDDRGFAWYISKALAAAGARLVFATHPRLVNVVGNILERDLDKESRQLPFGAGELKVERVLPCDVSYDTMADVDEKTLNDKRFSKHGDYSIQGMANTIAKDFGGGVDIFVHSIAFSPEIKNKAIDTSRKAYLTALSVSSFSLTAMLKALQPFMEHRPDGASAIALSYLGGDRVVPHYGGGMSTAKAALQIDAKQLASNLGPKNIRVNIISAGPYASRAASAIGDIDEMVRHSAACSPLPRGITPEEVGNTAAFLCSPLAAAITGHVLYVDCGYNVMGVFPKVE
ncbi:MAG: SDR family oxidoreductase [Gemmataceae bacterium]|nr:SDR family oxidoreductase [Gemmataceae bacterium]